MIQKFAWHKSYVNESVQLANSFYSWLVKCLRNDYFDVQKNKYYELFEEYQELLNNLENTSASDESYCLRLFNTSSNQKLLTVIECTKEEYKAISDELGKDLIYFNKLLGWYTDIISETKMFIEKIYESQMYQFTTLDLNELDLEFNVQKNIKIVNAFYVTNYPLTIQTVTKSQKEMLDEVAVTA